MSPYLDYIRVILNVKQIFFLFLNLYSATSIQTKVYSHQTNKQQLVFFGTTHSHDPKHTQYKKIKESFIEFTKRTTNEKIILIEGSSIELDKTTYEETAIRQGGDKLFAHLLGIKEDVMVADADIDKQTQTKQLLKTHSLEVVHAWSKKTLTKMWNRFTDQDKPGSLENYVASHLQRWFKYIDITNLKKTPVSTAQIETLNATILAMRQEHTFDIIQDYWNQGYDIFIVYGAAHARAHEQKIKTLLK